MSAMLTELLSNIPTATLSICAFVFLVLLVTGATLIGPNNQLKQRGSAELPMKLDGGPMLQVELARNENDIRRVLMTGDVAQNVRDARKGNTWDSFLFVPGYAGFLVVVGVLLARGDARFGRALILVALVAVPSAAVCDWLENYGISETLDHIEHGGGPEAGDAGRISIPSILKWGLIALTLLFYGVTAMRHPQAWERFLLGALLSGAGLAIVVILRQYAGEVRH